MGSCPAVAPALPMPVSGGKTMSRFAIVEVDHGLTVAEVKAHETPEDAALRMGGIVIDPGPFTGYEEACDALDQMKWEEELYEHE